MKEKFIKKTLVIPTLKFPKLMSTQSILQDGLATLVGKVRNSKVNEEMRAMIAAARDSKKAELEAEKMESARIHELLENARNKAKGNRPERRLSVPSEPSVDNSHFGADHK